MAMGFNYGVGYGQCSWYELPKRFCVFDTHRAYGRYTGAFLEMGLMTVDSGIKAWRVVAVPLAGTAISFSGLNP